MNNKEFTSQDFKAFKKAFKLTNKDVAKIIGTGETNVKNQTAPNKPIATWAKAFCFMFEKMSEQRFLDENVKTPQ